MSNLERLISSVEVYISQLNSKKSDNDHEHTGYVNRNDLSEVSFSGSYNDLNDTPIIPSVEGLASETFVTNAINEAKLSGDGNDIDLSIYAKSSDLSTVATSGSYNDLTNKPTIPSINGLASEVYIDNSLKNSIGVPLSKYPRLSDEVDDSNRITRAFSENNVVVIDSDLTITSINIPDNCKLYCFGNYTITTSGTIKLGYQSYFIGENLTIDASSCTTEDLKIVSLSKWAKVVLYQIIGYKSEDSVKGSGSNATAIYCEYSDFVQVDILRSIKYCKIAFYIKSGMSGTGNTINRSHFNSAWIGDCYKCFVSDASTSIMIDTSAYMEQCTIGYELRAGFYGSHYTRFDHVDNWFVNLLKEFRTRLGDFYIRGCTMSELLNQIKAKKINENEDWNTGDNLGIEEDDRYFMYTTWHCNDGIILPSDKDNPYNPQIISDPNGRLVLASGLSKLRMISAESIQSQGKENDNDTSGGTVITLGGDYSEFHVERQDGTSVMSMNKIGLLKTRNGIELGNSTVGNANLDIKKGGVILGRTPPANAKNNMIYVNSDNNKLIFVDNDGVSHNVIIDDSLFSGDYNDLVNKPTIPSIEGLATEAYVDQEIAKLDLSNTNVSAYKRFTITSSEWVLDSSNNLYSLDLTHELNTKDIIVNSRNSSTGYNIILSSICVDENNIKIYNDDNPDCIITIISIQNNFVSTDEIKAYIDQEITSVLEGRY